MEKVVINSLMNSFERVLLGINNQTRSGEFPSQAKNEPLDPKEKIKK